MIRDKINQNKTKNVNFFNSFEINNNKKKEAYETLHFQYKTKANQTIN